MKMELLENLIRKLPVDLWFVAHRVKLTTKGIMIDREIEALKNRGFDRRF
jgi:molybdenum cofactor biosynthesis enzyme MoaA